MINTVIDRMRDNPQAVADPAVKAALESLKATADANATPSVNSEARGALDVERKALSELEGGEYPKRHREGLKSMTGPGLKKAEELLPKVKKDAMLLLAGTRGNGKTQLATYLAYHRRLTHGLTAGKYIKALDLFEALKETWSNRSSEDSVMRPYRQCGMLVIDEIHERGESEWETRKLVNLIDHRYDRMLVTLLVGNIAPNEVTARLSPSIVSRMKETGGIINCDWPSYR